MLLVCLVSLGCSGGEPGIAILTPANGEITSASTITVTGVVANVDPATIADVRVNGVSVLPLDANQNFTASVPVNTGTIVHPILAEVVGTGGAQLQHRIVVFAGDSVPEGGFSPGGIALRLTDSGLDQLEPLVTSLVPLDLAALVPPGTLVVDNYCYLDSIFGCLGRIDATISGSPPPSLSSYSVDVDSYSGFVAGDITLFDLFFRANVVAVSGIGFSCTVDITAGSTLIIGDYGLEPYAPLPEEVDVTQLGGVAVSFGSFNDNTNCGGFLGGVVEFFIDLFISDLQNDLVRPGLEDFLNATDSSGNTPIASALEVALSSLEIAGSIGTALGLNLEAPMFAIAEDTGGVTLGSDARVSTLLPDPDAVDLSESYHVDQSFPTFGALAPNGQPYHLGLCVSASAFNQLLKAEIESGLLITSIQEFDFGNGPEPILAGSLSILIPELGFLDPAEPLGFEIYPTTAPIMTGALGPAGELARLEVGHLLLTAVPLVDPSVPLVQAAVDVAIGLDANLTNGELSFTLGTPAPEDIQTTILQNPFFIDEARLDILLPGLLSVAVPVLGDSLGSFPLPQFLGLELTLVDIDRTGEYLSLFLDLTPAP